MESKSDSKSHITENKYHVRYYIHHTMPVSGMLGYRVPDTRLAYPNTNGGSGTRHVSL